MPQFFRKFTRKNEGPSTIPLPDPRKLVRKKTPVARAPLNAKPLGIPPTPVNQEAEASRPGLSENGVDQGDFMSDSELQKLMVNGTFDYGYTAPPPDDPPPEPWSRPAAVVGPEDYGEFEPFHIPSPPPAPPSASAVIGPEDYGEFDPPNTISAPPPPQEIDTSLTEANMQRRYSNSSELSYLDVSPPQAHTLPQPPPLPPRGTLRVSPNAHSPNPAPTTNDYRPPLPPRNRSEAGRKLRRSNARSRSGATTPEGPPPLRPARSRSLSLGRFRSPEPSYTGHAFYDPIPVAAPLPNNGNLGTELHDNEGQRIHSPGPPAYSDCIPAIAAAHDQNTDPALFAQVSNWLERVHPPTGSEPIQIPGSPSIANDEIDMAQRQSPTTVSETPPPVQDGIPTSSSTASSRAKGKRKAVPQQYYIETGSLPSPSPPVSPHSPGISRSNEHQTHVNGVIPQYFQSGSQPSPPVSPTQTRSPAPPLGPRRYTETMPNPRTSSRNNNAKSSSNQNGSRNEVIAMAIAKASKFYDKQKMRQRRMSSPGTMSSSNGHGQGYTAPARSAGITGTSTSNMSSTPGRPNGTASESASATSPGPSMNPEEDRAAKVQAMQLAAHTAARWIGGLSKPQEGFSLHAAEKEDLINAAKTLLK